MRRSWGVGIAGNGLPLYGDMTRLNADELARRFNVVAKHSLEKTSAANFDCFATVSDLTARECRYLLGKEVDVVTPNGFEDDIVWEEAELLEKRASALQGDDRSRRRPVSASNTTANR